MLIGLLLLLLLLLGLAAGIGGAPAPVPAPVGPATCPLNLSYVATFPWDRTACLPDNTSANLTNCCTTLLSLLGVAFAERLRTTHRFRLPDVPSSAACLSSFSARISALSLSSSLVPSCFPDPARFVITPSFCAGVENLADWTARLGPSTALDSACAPDLSDLTRCSVCYNAAVAVASQLTALDGNSSNALNCIYLTYLYAAGIANRLSPYDPSNPACTLGLGLAARNNTSSSSPSSSKSNTAVAASASAAAALALLSSVFAAYLWRARRRRKATTNGDSAGSVSRGHLRPNTGSIWYALKDLERATAYFSPKNLIGRGGFGVVYRGVLPDGTAVAVKKVLESDFQGDEEFRNEVEIISNLRHRNLVPLRGCCITEADEEEGKQWFLVYDLMPNGSLDEHLFGSRRPPLTWPQRKSIILDVAKGLAYLHYGVKPAIFHRDIKATNILLDGEMRARVADFGLAKQSREGQSHLTTRVAGTHGYLAPEYALYGQLTEKSDVYSFGVLVLELMSGRKALDVSTPSSLVLVTDWAWTLVKSGRAEEVIDAAIRRDEEGNANPSGVMERFVLVGILCAHVMVALRPTIADALRMIEGDIEVPAIPDRPLPLGHGPVYTAGANTFIASPTLSGPVLNPGDMLR